MPQQILVIEDEAAINELICVNLRHAGYDVESAIDGSSAEQAIASTAPDLIILDWMLPDTNGVDLAMKFRAHPGIQTVPIIMLTARAQEGDKLAGFEAGVDDYMTKPFSPRELVARVKAVIRRLPVNPDTDPPLRQIQLGGLRIEPDTHRVFADDEPLSLSPTEFKLLHCLMRRPDRVLSRSLLLDTVWGNETSIEERTVDVHIRRLRLALKPSAMDKRIETVRGGGYRFDPT